MCARSLPPCTRRVPDGLVRSRREGCYRAISRFSRHEGESGSKGVRREAYVSTEQETSSHQARLSRSYVHPRRSGRVEGPAPEGPSPAVGLIQRLRTRESFARLRREGTRVRSGSVWCVMLADASLGEAFVAFAIGRTAGSAVHRNRARRRLREILRGLDLAPGLYLFGLTGDARSTSFADLDRAVSSLTPRLTGA